MPRPVSGKTTVYRYKVSKKNGYSYVYERTERYDPELKRMVKIGGVTLLGKVKDDDPEQTLLKTRPKRSASSKKTSKSNAISDNTSCQDSRQKTFAKFPEPEKPDAAPGIEQALHYRPGVSRILDFIAAKLKTAVRRQQSGRFVIFTSTSICPDVPGCRPGSISC